MIALAPADGAQRAAAEPSHANFEVKESDQQSTLQKMPTAPVAALQGDPYNTSAAVSSAHAQALLMASLGHAVFPLHGMKNGNCTCGNASCPDPGKHPRRKNYLNEATTDPAFINMWFKYEPDSNYGVRLGREIGNTGKMAMVVDVDHYKVGGAEALEELEKVHGRLPETVEVLTGAGGSHYYFVTDRSLSFAGKMGKNIDLKVNGYVVGPGSVHASGRRYEMEASSDLFDGHVMADLPQWVSDHFSKSAKLTDSGVEIAPNAEPLLPFERASIKHDLDVISAACSRDEWLKILMALHSRSQSKDMFDLADEWSQACPEKYDADAVTKAWNSFKPNGGISYDHIHGIVRSEIAKSVDLTKLMESLNRMPVSVKVDNVMKAPLATAATTVTRRYKLLTATDLANAPPLKWMVRSLFPQSGLAALYGASGTGKSFLALDLAVTVAGGGDEWYGMRVTKCPVTYCVLEGEGGMGKRAKAWAQHHNKPLPDELRFVTQPINLLNQDDVRELAAAVLDAGGRGGFIILDTLNRAAPEADENSSKDMGVIIAAAKALQALTGGLVMLVHHTGKDSERGMRGHSSLFAAMDSVISVSKTHWEVKKSKDDATGMEFKFKLETLVLGLDDEDEDVTSCVAVPVAASFALRQSKKLGPHQLVALETIQGMATDFISSVHVDKAVAAVAERLDVDHKHKRERAKAAIGALSDKGKIKIETNYIRLV